MSNRRILLIASAVGALAVMALVAHLVWSGRGEALRAAEVIACGYAFILEARLDATLRRADADLQQVQRTVTAAALTLSAVPDNARINALLTTLLINFPELVSVNVFDAAGDVLYRSGGQAARLNIADRDYFRKLRDEPGTERVFSEVIVARTTGRPAITCTRPLRDERGEFRGVVVALIDLDHFQRLFRTLDVGARGNVAIYRSDDFRQVVRWPEANARLNVALPADSPARAALTGANRAGRAVTVTMTSATDGIDRTYALHALDRYPFFVAVGMAREDALAGWRDRALKAGLYTLLLMLLLLVLMIRLGRAEAVRIRLASIVENSNDAIISRTLDGVILSWNSGAERMLGYTAAEAVGQPISFIAPADRPSRLAETNEQLLRGEAAPREAERRTRDGRVIAVSTSFSLIRDGGGKVTGVSVILQDIAALKRAQLALEQSEARFRATFDQAAVGIAHFDLDQRNIRANRRYSEIVGYPPEELLGKLPGLLSLPGDTMPIVEQRRQLLTRAIDHSTEERRYYRKDGRVIWVTRTESLARDGAGTPLYFIRVIEDITERKASEERYRATFDNAPVGIMQTEIDSSRILHVNRKLCEMLGYTQDELLRMSTGDFVHPDYRGAERRYVRKDGRVIWVNRTVSLVYDAAGKPIYFIRIIEDITERKQAAQAQAQLASIVQTSQDAILARAPDHTIISWNAAAQRMFGWSAQEAIGQSFRTLFSIASERPSRRFEKVLRGEFVEPFEELRPRKDGSTIHVETSLSAVRDDQGKVLFVSCTMRDVTERVLAERQIEQLATRDALTGLPNRNMLMEKMYEAIARAARARTHLAVMFVDLDRFKEVNDTLGHAAGDELLRDCARRLVDCVREVDIVSRLGGDEFVVLLTDVADTATVSSVAERMLKLLTEPYRLRGRDAITSASIGICFYPADGQDATALMKNADIAMYQAKGQGRNNYQFFAEEMNQRMIQRLQLEQELRAAVENKEFVLHYQPQVNVATGEIEGAESLLRWQHPTRGLLAPGEFIALAEETGIIVPIGEWILNHACEAIKSWRAKGVTVPHVVVNVSPGQLSDDLVTLVREALVHHGIEPGWLMIEITETMLMERVDEAIGILRRIRDLGIRIAMDDFGTGYSSLSVLQRLPLDMLKIDRSFVSVIDDEANNARACAIIGAIVAIAKEINLSVVAEGVETPTQLAFLRTLNCDIYQGFLYSKPVDTLAIEIRFAALAKSVIGDEQGRSVSVTSRVTLDLDADRR